MAQSMTNTAVLYKIMFDAFYDTIMNSNNSLFS